MLPFKLIYKRLHFDPLTNGLDADINSSGRNGRIPLDFAICRLAAVYVSF